MREYVRGRGEVCGREERKYEVLGRTIEGVCEKERGSVWEGGEEV